MNEPLGSLADVITDSIPAGGRIEDGEINIGIGVSGVEESAEANGFLCFPELENSVDVDEVVEEAAVLVPALAGADGA